MSKIKICLAIGDSAAEEWLMSEILKRDNQIEFTKPAIHRSAVLDRIAFDNPSILIISEGLSKDGNALSFDAVIKTIRTKYMGCRIIILAGNHETGDDFLNKMVSRGVYDIITGVTVNLYDVVECVFTPKDYNYAEQLQGLETTLNSEEEKAPVSMVEVIGDGRADSNGITEQTAFSEVPQSEPSPAINNVNEARQEAVEDYGTSILRAPNPTLLNDESYGTSVLSTPDSRVQRGVLFRRLTDNRNIQNVQPTQQGTVDRKVQNSYPVTNSRVLTRNDNNFIQNNPIVVRNQFVPKIITFIGARQGVGCTTALINTAHALAFQGKRVCVIDAVWNEKSVFDKLRLPHSQNGFGNNMNHPLPPGFLSSYAVRFPERSESGGIQFLELITGEIISENLVSTIRSFSNYHYILLDMSIAYFNQFLTGLIRLSDKVVAVTVQDSYEMMVLKNYLNAYSTEVGIYNNLMVLMNKSSEKLNPSVIDVQKYLGVKEVLMIPSDTVGFVRASSRDGIYINGGKRRIVRAFYSLAEKLS